MSGSQERAIAAIRRLRDCEGIPKVFLDEVQHALPLTGEVARGGKWSDRFADLTKRVNSNADWDRQIEDHVFELKVMSYLASLPNVSPTDLEYEPSPVNSRGRNVDLSLRVNDKCYLVELKAAHPQLDFDVIIDLGPDSETSPRGASANATERMHERGVRSLLDRAAETELKLSNYELDAAGVIGIRLSARLGVDHVRQVVTEYRSAGHGKRGLSANRPTTTRAGTPRFRGTIDAFWAFHFDQFGFDPHVVTSTRAPELPVQVSEHCTGDRFISDVLSG